MEVAAGNINDKIDQLELAMQDCEPIHCPLNHTFIKGMYIRKIFMPAGKNGKVNIITSQVHNTVHPFFVMAGKVAVMSENDGEQIIEAPFDSITLPNTRRFLRIIEDCTWITCHATDIMPNGDTEQDILDAVDRVEADITIPYVNPLLGGVMRNNVLMKEIKEV